MRGLERTQLPAASELQRERLSLQEMLRKRAARRGRNRRIFERDAEVKVQWSFAVNRLGNLLFAGRFDELVGQPAPVQRHHDLEALACVVHIAGDAVLPCDACGRLFGHAPKFVPNCAIPSLENSIDGERERNVMAAPGAVQHASEIRGSA